MMLADGHLRVDGGQSVLAAGVDEAENRCALLVGCLQIHLHVEAPVVVARRVVQDLPHPPQAGLPVDDLQRRAPGVGACAYVVVLVEVCAADLLPALGRPPGIPSAYVEEVRATFDAGVFFKRVIQLGALRAVRRSLKPDYISELSRHRSMPESDAYRSISLSSSGVK